jgi:SAM-dependent methyltransferase
MMSAVEGADPPTEVLGPGERGWLQQSYDAFPRVEAAFNTVLDVSLQPRGPELLYELVQGMGLPTGSVAVDVGCGEGKQSFQLAEGFRFDVVGLDPVPRNVELACAGLASLDPDIARNIRFVLGAAEELPLDDQSVGLVWCRDVLVHVADLDRAYSEFHRVLRAGGRALVYQMFAGDRLEPREAEWLWKTMGVVTTSTDRTLTEKAISAAGLRVDECIDLSEWGEWAEEHSGKGGQRLLYASRLLRDPQRYVARFGEAAYQIMLGDCFWHIYGMIGKLERRVYVLSKT